MPSYVLGRFFDRLPARGILGLLRPAGPAGHRPTALVVGTTPDTDRTRPTDDTDPDDMVGRAPAGPEERDAMDDIQAAEFQFAGQDIPWLLRSWAESQPETTFLIWEPRHGESRTWSYAQFWLDVRGWRPAWPTGGSPTGTRS